MEELVKDLFVGVASNAIYTVLTQTNALPEDDSVPEAIAVALAELTEVPKVDPGLGGEQLRDFMLSAEVAGLARQVYVSRLDQASLSLDAVRADFCLAFSAWDGLPDAPDAAERLFDALTRHCDTALEAALRAGSISAHEARSTARFRVLLDEFGALRSALDRLQPGGSADLSEISRFEEQFRVQVTVRHGTITPPNLDEARRVPIDDLFVDPLFRPITTTDDLPLLDWDTSVLMDRAFRAVVLGNPGGGKSTFAEKLCYDIASGRHPDAYGRRGVTPFLVVLRDFGAEKQTDPCSIKDFVDQRCNSVYQELPPAGALEYLFESGRALVIFDGLDELLDTSYRQEIAKDIEAFSGRYPNVPILVTSREVGYEQAPLDPREFVAVTLGEFDPARVEEYVRKWFDSNTDLSATDRANEAAALLKESEVVPDLRSNALMLALICNIYRGQGYIPRNRPAVYERCALMLFDRWDRKRQIQVPLEFERHLRPAMEHLAHWIYSSPALQSGVTEAQLVAEAARYLAERRFDSEDDALAEARRFVEFCRGRAWVFTDVGLTPDGDDLFRFTHRTFLEYFTAQHLVRAHRTPEDLASVLLPRIGVGEWDVIAQLAFQIQDQNMDGAGDDLLALLLPADLALDGTREPAYRLAFAARSLEFLVPRPPVTSRIAGLVFEAAVDWVRRPPQDDESTSTRHPISALRALLAAGWENRQVIASRLTRETVDLISTGDDSTARIAASLSLNLDMAIESGPSGRDDLRGIQEGVLGSCESKLLELAAQSFAVAFDLALADVISVEHVAHLHGASSLFEFRAFVGHTGRMRNSLAETAVATLSRALSPGWHTSPEERDASRERALRDLGQIGRFLRDAETPWWATETVHVGGGWLFRLHPHASKPAAVGPLPPDAAFGLVAASAVAAERARYSNDEASVLQGVMAGPDPIPALEPLFRRRFGEEPLAVDPSALGLDSRGVEWAQAWAAGELDVVRWEPEHRPIHY